MNKPSVTVVLVCCLLACASAIKVSRMDGSAKYEVVRYLTDELIKVDSKVRDVTINKSLLYTHIFDAFDTMAKELSLITTNSRASRFPQGPAELVGANMVLSHGSIKNMYAAGRLAEVVDFVLNCYAWARPSQLDESHGFVSILRAHTSPYVNQAMLKQVARKVKAMAEVTEHGLYHNLWESASPKMRQFLGELGYKLVTCGDQMNICDWANVGLPRSLARDQCLYQLVVRKNATTEAQAQVVRDSRPPHRTRTSRFSQRLPSH